MKKKSTKYAKNGAIIFGISNSLINAFQQINSINESSQEKFNWTEMLKSGGKGVLYGGVVGFLYGSVEDFYNSKEEKLNTNAILGSVISNARLDKNNPVYKNLSFKSEEIIKLIKKKFKNQLAEKPIKVGSTQENTSLSNNFDIDIAIPFKSNSFNSTEDMFYSVYQVLNDDYYDKSLLKVRKQKKSIGVILELNNEEFKIDVVPYKLTTNKGTSGYLFVNSNSIFNEDSYTKTDIESLKSIKLSNEQKKLLVALKLWRENEGVSFSSHLMKLFILDAYKVNVEEIPRSFTKKLIFVFNHIEKMILTKRIVSVENTNNVLTNFNEADKISIKEKCKKVLEDYEYQPNSILKYI